MDKTYQKVLRRGIDLSPVGVERRADGVPYFCTPKGASVFGWAGVDGIHFCFVRGFGGMVFAVSPENISPNYVHPLSGNFEDFLRLLLACGDAAALEQAWMWNKAQFEAFLQDNPPTQEQQNTLSEIAMKMELEPMEQPWEYIKELQTSFDYSKIKYTEDLCDPDMNPSADLNPPEWKVCFDGGWRSGNERAGTEIRLDRQFDWAGRHWVIPAMYSCSRGLVIDFCMRVETESIRGFMRKWNLDAGNGSFENSTQEQQMLMHLENPLSLNFKPRFTLNGKSMEAAHSCSVCFNPCISDGGIDKAEAKWVIDHYGLDASCGWMIYRNAIPWQSKRRPEIKSLALTMEQMADLVPGPHFRTHAPGDSFTFAHPVNGTEYTLTVQELEQQMLPQNSLRSRRWFCPTHYTMMSYTLSPEPNERIGIQDCDEGDRPLEIMPDESSRVPAEVAGIDCIGVIGGTDGPAAVLAFGKSQQSQTHTACSSLHFEPIPGDVEWSTMFSIKQYDAATFLLDTP